MGQDIHSHLCPYTDPQPLYEPATVSLRFFWDCAYCLLFKIKQHLSTFTSRWDFYMKTRQHACITLKNPLPQNFILSPEFEHSPLPVSCFPKCGKWCTHNLPSNDQFSCHLHDFYTEAHLVRNGPTLSPRHYASGTLTQPRRGTTGSCKSFFLLPPSFQGFWPFIIMNGRKRESSVGNPLLFFSARKWFTPF